MVLQMCQKKCSCDSLRKEAVGVINQTSVFTRAEGRLNKAKKMIEENGPYPKHTEAYRKANDKFVKVQSNMEHYPKRTVARRISGAKKSITKGLSSIGNMFKTTSAPKLAKVLVHA